ncbi:hypothetical protein G3I40_12255 [Streptomyces sp. SID14478]|uniref:hypothetical protein n=1 Tax=Streptomyces sp. SID14478 TaxID=2706073 RepID=UPI0013DCFE15|nr:hypothetical protein [Streptomyces sp. SID14478]NEB75987.1 hypothetical protein [Streptomyces sp. SID14478]
MPPARLPRARIWPRWWRDGWQEHTLRRQGGVWRAIPDADPLRRHDDAHCALEAEVVAQLRNLQASRHAHRHREDVYEFYVPAPSGVLGESQPAPPLFGLPQQHWINRTFHPAAGYRIQPGRQAEVRQMQTDRAAVGDRALAYGDAALALLEHHHGPAAAVPGIIAIVSAIAVFKAQVPIVEYFYVGGPMERYERQYGDGCLATSPYRMGKIQTVAQDGELTVRPIDGGVTLRLGPARQHGTEPLRPLDAATRTALDRHGC